MHTNGRKIATDGNSASVINTFIVTKILLVLMSSSGFLQIVLVYLGSANADKRSPHNTATSRVKSAGQRQYYSQIFLHQH